LESEINKRHPAVVARKPLAMSPTAPATAAETLPRGPVRVQFKVRLDSLGHLMIQCFHGAERVETGLRGLSTLIQNGMMLKPGNIHLDPLQRGVEIDGVLFESSDAGARQLEETLNARYAPTLDAEHQQAVEIRENPASPTGFDIHFVTVRVGARFDVKGHLTQAQLDILQDPIKCGLLQRGILLRISPPHLIVRRKRPDGGEERVPEIPDLNYLRAAAQQLQQFFNHPSIHKTGGTTVEQALSAAELHPEEVIEMQLVRDPKDKTSLWLECVTIRGGRLKWRALTHHDVAELQGIGVFLPHIDVNLSLDNRTLSILNTQTNQEEALSVDGQCSDEDLSKASRMLAAALKPARPQITAPPPEPKAVPQTPETQSLEDETVGAAQSPAPVAEMPAPLPAERPESSPSLPSTAISRPSEAPTVEATDKHEAAATPPLPTTGDTTVASPPAATPSTVGAEPRSPEVPTGPQLDPIILALCAQTDPLRTNIEIFRRLADHFGVAVQDIRLSLPRVFSDRRFEIINFGGQPIESVLELRSNEFYGFYLSHLGEQRIDFVYACRGIHIEWGADKCVLQPASDAEAVEFKGDALLGMTQTRDNQFGFVVTPAYRQWVRLYEPRCREGFAHFLTANDLAADPEGYAFIWPERPASEADVASG